MPPPTIVPKFKPVYLLWLLVPLLLWWALKDIEWAGVWAAIARLHLWQVGVLLALNLLTLLSFSGIWYVVLVGCGQRVPFLKLAAYRTASFGVSYFTPGPQFGGEPLQVYLLMRNHGLPLAVAAASTVLDKVLELVFNFVFLMAGLIVVAGQGRASPTLFGLMAVVLGGVLALFVAEWRGTMPVAALLRRLSLGKTRPGWIERATQAVTEIEKLVADFCRTQPHLLLAALGISLLNWTLVLLEYWISLYFLGLSLTAYQLVVAVTLNRLAFLAPLPGGLGALEGSQVLAMTTLGLDPAVGVSQGLIIRARDIAVGLVGLVIGWRAGARGAAN